MASDDFSPPWDTFQDPQQMPDHGLHRILYPVFYPVLHTLLIKFNV